MLKIGGLRKGAKSRNSLQLKRSNRCCTPDGKATGARYCRCAAPPPDVSKTSSVNNEHALINLESIRMDGTGNRERSRMRASFCDSLVPSYTYPFNLRFD